MLETVLREERIVRKRITIRTVKVAPNAIIKSWKIQGVRVKILTHATRAKIYDTESHTSHALFAFRILRKFGD